MIRSSHRTSRNRNRNRKRIGAAVVEFAVCLPIIILIVFGSIEAASLLFLRQALVQASYEGVKTAVRRGGDESLAILAATDVLDGRSLEGFTIELEPSDVSTVERGQPITMIVSAPGEENSLFPFGPFRNQNVVATATMVKE